MRAVRLGRHRIGVQLRTRTTLGGFGGLKIADFHAGFGAFFDCAHFFLIWLFEG